MNKLGHRICISLMFLSFFIFFITDGTEILSCAVKALKDGHVVAVPTDTIYGLACLAQNSEAVRKIYDVKGRNGHKPLAICVGEIQEIYKWVRLMLYFIYFFNNYLCFDSIDCVDRLMTSWSCKLHKTTEESLHDKLNGVLLCNCFHLISDHLFLKMWTKIKSSAHRFTW